MRCLVKPSLGVVCVTALAWALASPNAAFAGHRSYGSWGSSGGSYGSSGGSYGSHGSSGGSYGSSGGYILVDPPVQQSRRYYSRRNQQVVHLELRVPGEAKLYLEDQLMTLTGPVRRFVSPVLRRGMKYIYNIRVEVQREGTPLSKTTRVDVTPGQRIQVTVSFTKDQPSQLAATVRTLRTRG